MANNIQKFKDDLGKLVTLGERLELSMIREAYGAEYLAKALSTETKKISIDYVNKLPNFGKTYEKWYSEALVVLEQILPNRVHDFKMHYEKPKGRKDISYENYIIQDFLQGLQVKSYGEVKVNSQAAIPRFQQQLAILSSCAARFESSLFEIKQIVQADLFDSEIDAARELHKKKFLRAAGAIAGVVLEKHLAQVCQDHSVKITKKNPTIADYNDALKTQGVIDVAGWRHVSFLGDIRNLCDHNKSQDPTPEQVRDLIDGTDKVLRTII
ncbi:MAG: hypothetical protein PHD48_01575 [Alphaproteobacteria bacterium]|nr:hypothetical protein [Alphaproteobacteria bacterium]